MAQATPGAYYVPHGTHWPILGSIGLTSTVVGAALWMNETTHAGKYIMFFGIACLLSMMFGWFRQVIGESLAGIYTKQVDTSFRMGMMWFIFSEVMFFAAFFGALFYARQLSVPWLGGEGAKAVTSLLWPNFEAGWPSNGPGDLGPRDDGSYEIIPAFGLPALNTALLLTSGLTITIAHHALKSGHRGLLKVFLALTFLLGFVFLGVQFKEYWHAYHELGLQLGTGIYGSTFFMLTGFRGLHVFVGAVMLVVIWLRCMSGHFTPRQHFAFEAVAWYWHFVDVVWLGLFIFVYWL